MLGSWSNKADLRKAVSEVASLKAKLEQNTRQPSSLKGISSMLNLPEVKPAPPPRRHKPFTRPTPAPESHLSTTENPSDSTPLLPQTHSTNSMQNNLEAAANLWKVRVDLARNSFVSNVTTNDEQAMQFEVSMIAMNLRLSNSIRTWVDQIKQDKNLTPEKSIFMLNDLSSTLVWAYKDLDRTQPVNWREKAGPKFQVFDFINPEVARPLMETDGVFQRRHRAEAPDDFTTTPDEP